MSLAVYECRRATPRAHTLPSSFLSIIETIIASIPLPFKPDKLRLVATGGEKKISRESTADRRNFFNLPSLCASLVRFGSPSAVNYSRLGRALCSAILRLIFQGDG